MEQDLGELEAILRDRICAVCSSRDVLGNCGLENPADCALFRLFRQVVEAVGEVRSNNIVDYVRAIRKNVCSVCDGQAADGSCELRQQVRCALDAYLLPIVNAMEEAAIPEPCHAA